MPKNKTATASLTATAVSGGSLAWSALVNAVRGESGPGKSGPGKSGPSKSGPGKSGPVSVPRVRLPLLAPEIRRIGVGRWLSRWFLAAAAACSHVWALTWLSTRITSPFLYYGLVLLPIVITAILRPMRSLNRWYRWVVVYVLLIVSGSGEIFTLGEAWVLAAFFAPVAPAVAPMLVRAGSVRAGSQKLSGSTISLSGLWKLSHSVADRICRLGAR